MGELKSQELYNRQDTATSTVDTSPLQPPPPDKIIWGSLFALCLSAFIVGLTGLLSADYMSGYIDMSVIKAPTKSILRLDENYEVPDTLKMANFGLFRFCFSDDFMYIVTAAMKMSGNGMPEAPEGGMTLDFNFQCHDVIETENQPEKMKERTRIGKILMFMGLSSVFVTWLFLIMVLIAGRHLSKAITSISATCSVIFLISSLMVSMTLQGMTKIYLNEQIMASARSALIAEGIDIDFLESFGINFLTFQPVDMVTGSSGYLILTSAGIMMIIGIATFHKTRTHKPG